MKCRSGGVVIVAVLLVGCADPGTSTVPERKQPVNATRPQLEQSMKHIDKPTAGTIELPASMVAPAISDLAGRLQASETEIEVLRAVPVIWNNGAVGCPQPDMQYTQALIPGYWVVLGHQSKTYSYHSSRNGPLRLCANARPNPTARPPHGRYNESV